MTQFQFDVICWILALPIWVFAGWLGNEARKAYNRYENSSN
jgi:hypothetical protein